VAYTVDPNPAGTSRNATLTVDDVTVTMTQAPLCTYTVSPTGSVVAVGGGTASVNVTAPAECTWTATSANAWLTIVSGGSGAGNGLIGYAASANPDSAMRMATVTVTGTSHAVYQAGTTPDTTAPLITTRISPSATAAGWHNNDVTITYYCHDPSGITDCPAPIVITQEGANQVVTRTATDVFGNETSQSVTVNLDRTPGEVSVSSPADDTTTTAASVVLTGQVSDALSGIAGATCNGTAATIVGGQVECTVALAPGRNTVVLFARDAAGNGISSGVRVTRTGSSSVLRVDPGSRTMLVGESQSFNVLDDYGVVLETETWTSSDPNILTVDAEGVVTAVAEGAVTITATAASLTAEATVTVLAGTALPYGTVRWAVAPTTPDHVVEPLYPHRVDETVPDVFGVDIDYSYASSNNPVASTIRALTASGESRWTEAAIGIPMYGDSFGGIVAEILDEEYGDPYALVRYGGPVTAPSWRYESAGYIWAGAQAADGTIYTIESMPFTAFNGRVEYDHHIVVMDGQTGRVTARVPLDRSVSTFDVRTGDGEPCDRRLGIDVTEGGSAIVGPIVGADGNGYMQWSKHTSTGWGRCVIDYWYDPPGSDPPYAFTSIVTEHKTIDREHLLLRITPTGAVSEQTIFEYHYDGNSNPQSQPTAQGLSPDNSRRGRFRVVS